MPSLTRLPRWAFILHRMRFGSIQALHSCDLRISNGTSIDVAFCYCWGITELRHTERQIDAQQGHMHAYKAHLAIKHERSGTNFDICAFRLHQFTNDFAKLVCVGQLPGGGGRRERRVWARRRGDAIRRIHFMEAPTKRSHLLRALKI